MYMAREYIRGRIHYTLRQSIPSHDGFISRDLYALGNDPSRYIVYPGGNSYYLDEELTDALSERGISVDSDLLESLFMPFLSPDIRRAVETFHNRASTAKSPLTPARQDFIQYRMAPFDKRRLLFLKFGEVDPGPVENMPPTLFRGLTNKSRDEIEQRFMAQEARLKANELKTYLYAALDLQRFFDGFMAGKMPQALDQKKVDACFIKALCRINAELFTTGNGKASKSETLHPDLRRYVIMFFDHEYAHSSLLDDFARRFMNRHRHPPARPPRADVPMEQALADMELDPAEFRNMPRKFLTRHYRRLARKHHPDKGGNDKRFVALNQAYETLNDRLKNN